MASTRTPDISGNENAADSRELEQMVMGFRVYELQHLLAYANRCRSGKKPELLQRALELVRTTKNLAIQQKVVELAGRRIERPYVSTDGASCTGVNGYASSLPTSLYGSISNGNCSSLVPALPTAGQGGSLASAILHNAQRQNLDLHPNVTLMPLPFYDILAEVVTQTTLVPMTNEKFQENYITFTLSQNQINELAFYESAPLPRTELQLRFCLLDTNGEQKDDFPSGCNVRMNDKPVQLPNPIPTNKVGVEPKRPSRPVNVTPNTRPNSSVQRIHVAWNHDGTKHWTASVYIVRHVTSNILLQRLRAKGERSPAISIEMIKEKLNGDGDDDIAATSIRVSLLCPLGKMRMHLPCRLQQCNHLQCFDADLFLKMNEKKPTWSCPVCDKQTPFEDLQVDGYFMDVIEKTTSDECEVEVYEDGSWAPVIEKDDKTSQVSPEKRKAPERRPQFGSELAGVERPSSSCNRAESAETASSSVTIKPSSTENDQSVIDLTEDDSDDDQGGGGGGPSADDESSSSSVFRRLDWRSDAIRQMRLTQGSMVPSDSSTSPSIIVLDSPSPGLPLEAPDDPRNHVTSSRSHTAGAWCDSASMTMTKTNPVPIRPAPVVTSPQCGPSLSPPKKRYATIRQVASTGHLQSPMPTPLGSTPNDASTAFMASAFLNSAAAIASTASAQSMATGSAANFGCGMPLLSAMDFTKPGDAYQFGHVLTAPNGGTNRMGTNQAQRHETTSNDILVSGSAVPSPNLASTSMFNFPPPPLRFGPSATTNYMVNSAALFGNLAGFASPADFLSSASTSAAALAAAAAATGQPTDSIWDNRWSQEFQEFLNSCLPDSSSGPS